MLVSTCRRSFKVAPYGAPGVDSSMYLPYSGWNLGICELYHVDIVLMGNPMPRGDIAKSGFPAGSEFRRYQDNSRSTGHCCDRFCLFLRELGQDLGLTQGKSGILGFFVKADDHVFDLCVDVHFNAIVSIFAMLFNIASPMTFQKRKLGEATSRGSPGSPRLPRAARPPLCL